MPDEILKEFRWKDKQQLLVLVLFFILFSLSSLYSFYNYYDFSHNLGPQLLKPRGKNIVDEKIESDLKRFIKVYKENLLRSGIYGLTGSFFIGLVFSLVDLRGKYIRITKDCIIMSRRLNKPKIIQWASIASILKIEKNFVIVLLKSGEKVAINYVGMNQSEKDALIKILRAIIDEKKPPAEAVG